MTLNYSCSQLASVAEVTASASGCGITVDDSLLVSTILDQASDMLCYLSGMRVHGLCIRTVRPVTDFGCLMDPWGSWGGYNWSQVRQYRTGPVWLQGTIPLRGPNTDIIAVYIDGAIFPASSYGLIENRYLIRKDGSPWPTQNDLTKPLSQTGTWGINYRFGSAPDWLTKQAAIELTVELLTEAKGHDTHLPPGVTSANIQGANVSLADRAEALRNGADEAIPMISRFLGVYAPEGMNRSGVWSPELKLGYDLIEDEGPSGS